MTEEEFEYLQSDVARELIERYIGCEPTRVALATRSAVIATQIKNLNKCRHKLPSYYAARCIVPTISYEQSSSEQTAAVKDFSGSLAVDLTLGLGVDSLYLAKRFDRVIAVEIDPLRAAIARYNFAKLNVTNVEVVNGSAEEFLANFDSRADLIYIDPCRRGAGGESLYAVQQCAPNVVELLDVLRAKSRRVIIKLSPLFDVAQTYKIFGEDAACEVVTLDDECKEVLVHIATGGTDNQLKVTAIRDGRVVMNNFTREDVGYRGGKIAVDAQYICVADVGFYKSRTVEALMRGQGGYRFEGGYLFTEQPPCNFCGRVYRIEQAMPYDPKMLRSRFPRAIVHKRDFPYDTDKLGIKQGGAVHLFFAQRAAQPTVFLVTLHK
ncbi:SAM-dependent methyltransferase [Mucinivorans hirudinis]|uniref:SAM-dependent methyltransferase n=1 Tax=Mucinivorans hirudinis TaxID=1433126 RepID=A0A060RC97_9BACT|nr:SAM-dependent methyltransferase [Mucinivorans hirudinis]